MRIKQLCRSRLLRVKNAMECYASSSLMCEKRLHSHARNPMLLKAVNSWSWRCPPTTNVSHHCEHFSHYIPPTSLVLTIDFTLIQSQWMKKRRRIETNMSARCANRKFVMWAGEKNAMRKGCGKKLHLTHWLRATSEVKHFFFSVLLFVYYLRGVVFFIVSIFFRLLSAIFNFSHFSFFLRHRSQLKRFFYSIDFFFIAFYRARLFLRQ